MRKRQRTFKENNRKLQGIEFLVMVVGGSIRLVFKSVNLKKRWGRGTGLMVLNDISNGPFIEKLDK